MSAQELEDQANEAARCVNRVRAALDADRRKVLEQGLAELPPALDLAAAGTPRVSARSAALDSDHAPVTTLCASGEAALGPAAVMVSLD